MTTTSHSSGQVDHDALRRFAAQVLPAAAAGFDPVAHLERVLGVDRPDWRHRVGAALAPGAAEADWLRDLVVSGWWADPRSWPGVGWRAGPVGGWGELPDLPPLPTVPAWELAPSYDCVIVGSGAGGGTAAEVLAGSGRAVLVLELGDQPSAAPPVDTLRNPRATLGLPAPTDPDTAGRPRVSAPDGGGSQVVFAPDPGFGNNAFTVGGGTRVYGAQAWRFTPEDLAMAGRYGVPDGSDLADWPITYADLEPWYDRAERRFGVSGDVAADPWIPPRGPLPMPPITTTRSGELLAAAARRLGWGVVAPPLLINSVAYDGREACRRCPTCVGFDCPVGAKSGTHNTALPAAVAAGATLSTGVTVERILHTDGQITGVALVAVRDGRIWRGEVATPEVVVSAGATESARLLLLSGLGNDHDQVGRRLQGHVYSGAVGVFDEPVNDLVGPGVSVGTCDFRHGTEGLIGGGILANEFVMTPQAVYSHLRAVGLLPDAGEAGEQVMRDLAPRVTRVVGPIQEVTNRDSRVTLDPERTDRFGNPVARLSGSIHPADVAIQQRMTERAQQWLTEAGASTVISAGSARVGSYSSGQHQAGTCRMGTDPTRSVTDPYGRVWGTTGLVVADGSLHVTNGGVNPVLTILANAWRIADAMVG